MKGPAKSGKHATAQLPESGIMSGFQTVSATAKSVSKMVKWFALVPLIFCPFIAICLFIALATGTFGSGSPSGNLIYCVVTLPLAWVIYRAKPVNTELGLRDAVTVTAKFIAMVSVIVFLMALTFIALGSGTFDFTYLVYCVVTLLLAWGIYRVRSIAWPSVMLFLAALAFAALAGGIFHSSSAGAPRSNGPAGASLADLVTDLRKEKKLVGLAAMVMVDGQVKASAAVGERKNGSGVPIELGDRWHLGSITKSITATMIARLVESGQMKWTDTVGERFADAAIHEDWKPVTLQQLLTHTSGAPANFSLGVRLQEPALGPECTQARRKAVIAVMAEKPAHPPGEKLIPHNTYWHNGSNTMWYALVAFIPDKNMVVAVTSNDGDILQAESAAWKVVEACANEFNVEGDAARRKSLPPGD